MTLGNSLRPRHVLLKVLAIWFLSGAWGSSRAQAICGLEIALRELRREALREMSPDDWSSFASLRRSAIASSDTCSVCHIGRFGGPRNEFGSAINTLLTLRDRRDPVRLREMGRRMRDIVANPGLAESLTFGQLFRQGWAPESPIAGPFADGRPRIPAPPANLFKIAKPLSVLEAEEQVRRAESESRFGILQLSHVSELDPQVAAVLATFRGEALLLSVASLTPEVAAALARSEAETVWLPAVTTLSDEAAAAIRNLRGRLVLTGLTNLESVPLAEKLAANPDALSLPYLRDVTPEVATALARTSRSLTLASLTRPTVEVQERLAETVGTLSLPGLQSLDSLALAQKLANTLVLLPRVESLTVAQVESLVGIRGQDSFFGGVYLPLALVTPEIAQVLAATPRSINLILVGTEWTSNTVLTTLLNSRLNVTLADIEALSADQIRLISDALTRATAQPGVVQFPRLTLPKLQKLESAVLTETLGRISQYQFRGVRTLSPTAAAALGNFPNGQQRMRDGSVQILLSNLSFPDLEELSTESAQQLFKKPWSSIQLPAVEDVSLETLERLAGRTSALSLGITTLPEEFADAVGAVPFNLERGQGLLKLPRLRELSPAAARRLVDSLQRGVQELRATFGENVALPKLELGDDFAAPFDGLTSLSPEVARELARFEGSLTLQGLRELPEESALALASFPGPYLTLSGPGVEQISQETAAALAQVPGVLRISLRRLDSVPLAQRFARQLNWTLYDLESVSAEAGAALADYRPFFNLDALTELESIVMAARFVEGTTGGGQITLPAISRLSLEAADRLAQGPKKILLGLTVLDQPATAQALGRCQAGVELPRLRAVTPAVREILRESPSIKTPPFESLYVLSEAAPSSD